MIIMQLSRFFICYIRIMIYASLFLQRARVPDYDSMLKSLGDTGCDSKNFGLGFVDSDTYDVMRNEGKSVKSEEYYYAYRLNDSMTDDELKDELKKLKLESDAGNLLSFVKAGDNVRIQAACHL